MSENLTVRGKTREMLSVFVNDEVVINLPFSEADILGALARGYGSKDNAKKELDANLINAMAREILLLLNPEAIEYKEQGSILWDKKCIFCGGRIFDRIFWNETNWKENGQSNIEGYKCWTCGKKITKDQLVELHEPLREEIQLKKIIEYRLKLANSLNLVGKTFECTKEVLDILQDIYERMMIRNEL